MTLGERIDTKQNLSGIRLGNPNGTIDRTDRYVGALNIESIAKNDQLNDQVACDQMEGGDSGSGARPLAPYFNELAHVGRKDFC